MNVDFTEDFMNEGALGFAPHSSLKFMAHIFFFPPKTLLQIVYLSCLLLFSFQSLSGILLPLLFITIEFPLWLLFQLHTCIHLNALQNKNSVIILI